MLTFNFNNISPEKDSFMLDAGCGPGRHVFGFMDQFPDITCVGVDLDYDSLQEGKTNLTLFSSCLLYTSPSPRDKRQSRMPSSA